MNRNILHLIAALVILFNGSLFGDVSRISKMDDRNNPVALVKTSAGDIYIELFPREAPNTVKNFLGLAEGRKEFTDIRTGKKTRRPFYDGLIFHRVIERFMVQSGCPLGTGTSGPGYKFRDEINGAALGLDKIKAHNRDGSPHQWLLIRNEVQYKKNILAPLYRKMGIMTTKEFDKRRDEIMIQLKKLTLLEALKNMGYKYNKSLRAHHPKRGVIAMANSGPDTNGSQFFINVIDTPWLTGKHTVFGKVIEGMGIVDRISSVKTSSSGKPVKSIIIISIRKWVKR